VDPELLEELDEVERWVWQLVNIDYKIRAAIGVGLAYLFGGSIPLFVLLAVAGIAVLREVFVKPAAEHDARQNRAARNARPATAGQIDIDLREHVQHPVQGIVEDEPRRVLVPAVIDEPDDDESFKV
jgi:hypothetical protein